MPATATRSELLQERAWSWEALVGRIQPKGDRLAEWNSEFSAWRNEVLRLRTFEADFFLQEPQAPTLVRMHRGFLCHLISEGEKLALRLLEHERERPKEVSELQKQLGFLDEFILNLRMTLETWHSLEDRPEKGTNPLAAFV
ncbi:MAG TPA: hypothetical protein VGO11_27300 [Chthoniobacteraceae bacterium]|jgi:hypothetical protein|nr:hypothetical protein [Chthoniobacteraceae bacterium]